MPEPVTVLPEPGSSPGTDVRCSGCGACCSMVALRGGKDTYRFLLDSFPPERLSPEQRQNAQFIVAHMHEVNINVAAAINTRRVVQDPYNHYYLCDRYDAAERRCRAYDERPPMCMGFPFYGMDPQEEPDLAKGLAAYPTCSFWHAIPRERWPEHVTDATVTANPGAALRSVC